MAQNLRDTAFTFIFSNEAYMAQLYHYLTGREINPTQIRCVQLGDKLTKSRLYNDVAYITDDGHLLVMIEHQSSLNKNMLFRILEYYVALVSEFVIKENNYNKYGSKEMLIPKAEFHIVYNGRGEMDKVPELDLGDVKVRGSVTNIHFNKLAHHDPEHALVAYAKLVELVDEAGFDINNAIDQLLEEGYLIEFFGRKEIRDMFAEIFSYDQELVDKGRSEGVEIGLSEGVEIGRTEGKSEIARSLLESGMSIEDVHRHSNLSLDVIKKLA